VIIPNVAATGRLSFYYGRGASQSAPVMKTQEKKVPFDPKVFLATRESMHGRP